MNWYWKWRAKRRLKKQRCPFCGLLEVAATLYDGTANKPAVLCPELHHGYMYNINYDANKAGFKELSGGGKPMAIPEEYIVWKHEILADLQQ